MAYKLFQNKAAKFGSLQLTIRGGRISLNADAGDILVTLGMQFAHLLWDADDCKIAVKPIAKQDENAFRMSVKSGKRGRTFSAQSFLKYIHWSAVEPIVVAAEWNEREQLLEARLPKEYIGRGVKGGTVKRKNRGGT